MAEHSNVMLTARRKFANRLVIPDVAELSNVLLTARPRFAIRLVFPDVAELSDVGGDHSACSVKTPGHGGAFGCRGQSL